MDMILSLPFLVFIPMLFSIILISPFFTSNEVMVRKFAKGVCAFHLIYAILMLLFFNQSNPYESEISFWGMNWIQSLGIKFSFRADSISMILSVLTSFIFLLAAIASKFNIRKNHKFYYSMFLLLESAVLGIFTAGDMFLFFLFWELEMIPAYFLIGGNWGIGDLETVEQAKKSAIKFILFTFLGSMVMLMGILLVHYFNFEYNGFFSAMFNDINVSKLSIPKQLFISISLLIGFGVKLPIIPLHTWLPDAHTNAPTPISMVLAGVLLKTGAYGIYRFNYEILPDAFKIIAPVLALFAVFNIIYAAFVTYAQSDIKRIVAYSSISNMGLILLALCAVNNIGTTAAVFHMVSHGLVTAGLFMITGIVYLRYKDRDINSLGGIASNMPRLFGFSVLIVLASIGIPLFAPFVSEILTVISAINSEFSLIIKICAVLSLPVLILSSCYMLKFLHNGFFGQANVNCEKINDITVHEFVILGALLFGLILFGLCPSALINLIGLG